MDDLGLNPVHAVCARQEVAEINFERIEPQHPGQTETVWCGPSKLTKLPSKSGFCNDSFAHPN